jgi:hypothetical protein
MSHETFAALERRAAVWIGAILMLATYLAFSLRTLIDPVDPGELLSLKRLFAAATGTLVFWTVTRSAARSPADRIRERIPVLVLQAVGALGLVLAARVGFDLLASAGDDARLARNLRWIIAWAGYFAAALVAYVAVVSAVSARRPAASAFTSREDAVAWLIGEVSAWPEAERQAVAARIAGPQVYLEADPVAALLTPH